jgi:hypothetical protein
MGGCLRVGIPIIILVAVAIYCAFPHPTHSQTKLKEVAAESRHLMAAYPITPYDIPKDKWPPAIASLNPSSVTVRHGMVDITTRPYFDGGWGYGFAPDKRDLTMLVECWSELGQSVFWHGPC